MMPGTAIALLGMAAAGLSVLSLVPQVIRTWRTRSARDISAAWLVAALVATTLWMSYGSLIDAQAVIWANALTFVQAGFILVIKLRTQKHEPEARPARPPL